MEQVAGPLDREKRDTALFCFAEPGIGTDLFRLVGGGEEVFLFVV